MELELLIWPLVGFFLTLFVFSYFFGDNPLFRIVTYVFIGVTSGYVAVMVWYYVLWPKLIYPLMYGKTEERILIMVPLALCGLLVAKLFPRISGVGNVSTGYLVGVGVAVMVGGAVLGTIFDQVTATINLFDLSSSSGQGLSGVTQLLDGTFILFGTISTLAYFHFSVVAKPNIPPKRSRIIEILAEIGRIFIAITLGSLFAGVYAASLTALIERLGFIKEMFGLLF